MYFNKNGSEIYETLTTYSKKSGSLRSKVWYGPKLVVNLRDPDDIQTVLNSPNSMEKSYFYNFFQCNFGLFTSAGS